MPEVNAATALVVYGPLGIFVIILLAAVVSLYRRQMKQTDAVYENNNTLTGSIEKMASAWELQAARSSTRRRQDG